MFVLGIIEIPWWVLLLLVLIGAALAVYGYGVYKHTYFTRMGIRGPIPQLYWGNLKAMVSEGIDKFDSRCVEEYGLVWGFYWGNYPSIIVCDPEIVREITIKQFSKFYDRGDIVEQPKLWKNTVTNARGSKWKYLRAILQPTFSSSKIKAMRPIMKRCIGEFISCIDDQLHKFEDQTVDMHERYKSLTMDIICGTAFGIDVNSQKNTDDVFVKHVSKVFGANFTSTVLMLNFCFPDFRKIIMFFVKDWIPTESMDFLKATVKKAMLERQLDKSNGFNDLLKLMMDTQTDDPKQGVSESKSFEEMKVSGMSENDIVYNGIIFLAAGYETTTLLLTWMTYCLAINPEYQERLFKEIDQITGGIDSGITYDAILKMEYLEMVTQETLRLYPPASRFNRETACDVTIKGLKLEKGCDVMFSVFGIHRNPMFWPEPNTFDPERFSKASILNIVPYSFIPFGAGPRNCIGMKLALVETKMTIVRLLQEFRIEPSDKLRIPPEVEPTRLASITPKDGMCVKLSRRR